MRNTRNTRFQHPGRFGMAYPPLAFTLFLLMSFCSSLANAARPMITDDARITDAKACQLESWIRKNRHSTEYWAMPACNPTGNFELTIGGAQTQDEQVMRATDFVLQGKTIIKALEPNGWGMALTLGTDRHLASVAAGQDWYVNVPASISFADDRFVFHANLGWIREQESKRQRLTWGVGSETQLTERSWLIAEVFGQNQGKPFYQVGVRHWLIPDRLQIDTTFGNRAGGGNREERWFSVGLRVLAPPLFK